MYEDQTGYYVGDCKTPRGIEYFDVLLDKDQRSYLCHVKKGFKKETRDVCSQIGNALVNLTSVDIRGQTKTNSLNLEELKEKVPSLSELSDDEFLRVLGIGGKFANTRVFVLGFIINKNIDAFVPVSEIHSKKLNDLNTWSKYRSLEAEMTLKHEIPEDYIKTYLEENEDFRIQLCSTYDCFGNEVHEKVQSLLIDKGFVKHFNGKLLVCSKLLMCASQEEFKAIFPENLEKSCIGNLTRGMLLMLQKFTTFYESLLAKLEIIRCAKLFRQHLNKKLEFRICEIFANLEDGSASSAPTQQSSQDVNNPDSGASSSSGKKQLTPMASLQPPSVISKNGTKTKRNRSNSKQGAANKKRKNNKTTQKKT
jgi:hypothetical protein